MSTTLTYFFIVVPVMPEAAAKPSDTCQPASPANPAPMRRAIELMFFAYRDFTGEADAILAE